MKKLLLFTTLFINGLMFSQTWVVQNTGFATASRGILDISIVDANTVWALAYDGVTTTNNIQQFTKTVNGGTTWTPGSINVGNTTLQITNLSAVSATTAWAGAFDPTTGAGGVWKTSDSGATWTKQNTTAYSSSTSWFNLVHFFDANNGVAVGDPVGSDFEIYYTTNGGTTWSAPVGITLPNAITDEFGYNNSFTTYGDIIWVTTSKGRIFKSINKGVNWTVSTSPIADFGGTAISGKLHFNDANNGFILSSATTNNFYTTTNGGTTWSSASTFAGTHKLLSAVPNTSVIVGTSLVAPTGSSYSTNSGTTWTGIDTGTQRGVNKFLNPSTGWCGGFNTNATTGGIYKFSGTLATQSFEKTKLTVSPNPTNGIVTLTGLDITEVTIFDLLGKQVLNTKFDTLSEVSLDLSNLQTGAYLLKANSPNGSSTVKVMKN